MKVTAIAPWFGGKRTMADRIILELGQHSAYWEPFCGGMAVLLAKAESSHETVNDLHGELINLARVIADEESSALLYGRLSRTLCDEHLRKDSIASLAAAEDPIDRDYGYFIASWFGRNGFSGTTDEFKTSFAVRWTPTGGHGGKRFQSAVESIPDWHHRLRRCTILNRDGFEVIGKIADHPKVAIYVDPPYLSKGASYTHDFSHADHLRLAELLSRFKECRVVLSYYADARLGDLYPGWTVVSHTINKGLHNAGKRGQVGTDAPEVLLINGMSYTE